MYYSSKFHIGRTVCVGLTASYLSGTYYIIMSAWRTAADTGQWRRCNRCSLFYAPYSAISTPAWSFQFREQTVLSRRHLYFSFPFHSRRKSNRWRKAQNASSHKLRPAPALVTYAHFDPTYPPCRVKQACISGLVFLESRLNSTAHVINCLIFNF